MAGMLSRSVGCLGGPFGATGGFMKTLKKHLLFLCVEHSEVLERAVGVLGGSFGEALEPLGGPCAVPERSLGILGGPWWVLAGSLGPYPETVKKQFPRGLGAPWEPLRGSLRGVRAPLEALGGS